MTSWVNSIASVRHLYWYRYDIGTDFLRVDIEAKDRDLPVAEPQKKYRSESYRERHRVEGKCLWCSNPVEVKDGKKLSLCPRHTMVNRVRARNRTGSKPWGQTGKGRKG